MNGPSHGRGSPTFGGSARGNGGGNGGIASSTSGGWIDECWALAVDRIPMLNRRQGTDLDDSNFVTAGVLAEDNTRSFGVYTTPSGVGFGQIWLGKNATQIHIAAPKAESWFVRNRVLIPDTFTNAAGVVSVALSMPQGPPGFADAIWIVGRGTASTTVFQLEFYNPGLTQISLGAKATLGTPTCPLASLFCISAWFRSDTGLFTVEFSEEIAYQQFAPAGMSQLAAQVGTYANDQTKPMLVDAMFCAGVRANA